MTTQTEAPPDTAAPPQKPRSTARRAWISWLIRAGLALVLVAAGVGAGIWWEHRANTAKAATATTRTTLVAASLGTVKQTVAATGTLTPAHQSTLTFSASGTITAVDVAVGDTVTKGQTLAAISPTDLQSAVTLAQASVDAAQTQVDSSTAGTSAAASAEAQLASAQQQLASAQQALAGATLSAPMAGVVASVSYAVGDTVGSGSSSSGSGSGSGGTGTGGSGSGAGTGTGSSSSSSSSSGITVVNTSSWLVDATVTSSQLGELKKGLQATITPTGAIQPIFGTVASVGIVASSTSSGAAEFPVVIAVTGNPAGIHAGTTADVAITVKQLTDVLTVPTLAVGTTNGQTTVTVSKAGKTSVVPVTIGGVYGATTQITKGLAEGDQVVVTTRTFAGTGTGTTGRTGTGTRGEFGGGGFGGGGFGGGTGGLGGGTGGGTGRG